MAKPPKADLKDYMWCVGCQAYVPKKLLVQSSGSLFGDDGTSCPAGHSELQEAAEAASEPPKPS